MAYHTRGWLASSRCFFVLCFSFALSLTATVQGREEGKEEGKNKNKKSIDCYTSPVSFSSKLNLRLGCFGLGWWLRTAERDPAAKHIE
jgi:hypothetical protein